MTIKHLILSFTHLQLQVRNRIHNPSSPKTANDKRASPPLTPRAPSTSSRISSVRSSMSSMSFNASLLMIVVTTVTALPRLASPKTCKWPVHVCVTDNQKITIQSMHVKLNTLQPSKKGHFNPRLLAYTWGEARQKFNLPKLPFPSKKVCCVLLHNNRVYIRTTYNCCGS